MLRFWMFGLVGIAVLACAVGYADEEHGTCSESAVVRTKIPLLLDYERSAHHCKSKACGDASGQKACAHDCGTKRKLEFIDIPLVKIFKSESNGAEDRHTKVVDVPLLTVLDVDRDGENRSFDFIDTPVVSVIKTRKYENGDHERSFLKLPILGPVFSHSRHGDKTKTKFLFFKHTRRGPRRHRATQNPE